MWQQAMNASVGQHRQREGCHSVAFAHSPLPVLCWDCGQAVAGSVGLDVSTLVCCVANFFSDGLLP